MEETDLISKKELLQLTGISYGQLYRWKRENLIPEAWFIKKSSFTGQETYFPKEKILKRTSMILELKDKYSLEELANILSPELTNHSFHSSQLKGFSQLDEGILDVFKHKMDKEYFTFIELIFLYVISSLNKEISLAKDEAEDMVDAIKDWIPKLKDNNYNLILFQTGEKRLMMLARRDTQFLLDYRAEVVKIIDLEEVSKDLNLMFSGEAEELL